MGKMKQNNNCKLIRDMTKIGQMNLVNYSKFQSNDYNKDMEKNKTNRTHIQ